MEEWQIGVVAVMALALFAFLVWVEWKFDQEREAKARRLREAQQRAHERLEKELEARPIQFYSVPIPPPLEGLEVRHELASEYKKALEQKCGADSAFYNSPNLGGEKGRKWRSDTDFNQRAQMHDAPDRPAHGGASFDEDR